MKPRFDISKWPIAHKDGRRILREKILPEGIVLTGFEILSANLPLGNHFHAKKGEIFYLLGGKARWILQTVVMVDQKPVAYGERYEVDMVMGTPLAIPPYLAHTVILAPGSQMVCVNTEPFDQEDLISFTLL